MLLQNFTKFQSTLPVWGATWGLCLSMAWDEAFQSTLPVWGATYRGEPSNDGYNISIHAPRVGSDVRGRDQTAVWLNFNPRSPCGERLDGAGHVLELHLISIHAPRVGSDVG